LIVSSSALDDEHAALVRAVDTVNSDSGIGRLGISGRHEYDIPGHVPDASDFDLAVFLLGMRWGPPSGRYSSAFKRVFAEAIRCGVDRLLYFRALPDDLLVDPDTETAGIIAFRDEVERQRAEPVAWYDSPHHVQTLITDDLRRRLNPRTRKRPPLQVLPDHQKRLAGWMDALDRAKNSQGRVAFRTARRAFVYANQGRFTKACQRFALAIREAREPYLVNEYGLFLKANGLLLKAEILFQDLARMGQFMEDSLIIGSALRHLGDICQKTDRPEAADEYYQKALSMEKDYGRILKQAGLYEARGMVRLKSGSPHDALQMFEKALELYRRVDSVEGQALIYYCLTGAYIELEDAKRALEAGQNALELFRELNEPRMIDILQQLLAQLEDIRTHTPGRSSM